MTNKPLQEVTTLYIAKMDPETGERITVGRVVKEHGGFFFQYTRGVLKSPGFVPFPQMPSLYAIYRSPELFPLFAKRILDKKRPEYLEYLGWLGIDVDHEPLLPLSFGNTVSISFGNTVFDDTEVFPKPRRCEDGSYRIRFFGPPGPSRGRNIKRTIEEVTKSGLCLIPHAHHEGFNADIYIDDATCEWLGRMPRYLMKEYRKAEYTYTLKVVKINPDAPSQLRYMFELLTCPQHDLCVSEEFKPLSPGQEVCMQYIVRRNCSRYLRIVGQLHEIEQADTELRDMLNAMD